MGARVVTHMRFSRTGGDGHQGVVGGGGTCTGGGEWPLSTPLHSCVVLGRRPPSLPFWETGLESGPTSQAGLGGLEQGRAGRGRLCTPSGQPGLGPPCRDNHLAAQDNARTCPSPACHLATPTPCWALRQVPERETRPSGAHRRRPTGSRLQRSAATDVCPGPRECVLVPGDTPGRTRQRHADV